MVLDSIQRHHSIIERQAISNENKMNKDFVCEALNITLDTI